MTPILTYELMSNALALCVIICHKMSNMTYFDAYWQDIWHGIIWQYGYQKKRWDLRNAAIKFKMLKKNISNQNLKNSIINIFPLYFWKFPLYFQVWTFQRKMKKENSETLGNAFFYRLEWHISWRNFFAIFFANRDTLIPRSM